MKKVMGLPRSLLHALLIISVVPVSANAGCFACITIRPPKLPTLREIAPYVINPFLAPPVLKGLDNAAKGLDHTLKRNAKTIAVVGRATGCVATACISEAYIKYEKDKAEHKQLEKFAEYETRLRAEFASKGAVDKAARIVEETTQLAKDVKANQEWLEESDQRAQNLTNLVATLAAEDQYRVTMRSSGLPLEAGDPSYKSMADRFAQSKSSGDSTADAQLESAIQKKATEMNIDVATAFSSVIRWLSVEQVEWLLNQSKAALSAEQATNARIQLESQELKGRGTVLQHLIVELTPIQPITLGELHVRAEVVYPHSSFQDRFSNLSR